jgi:N6-adenosine-specific RNA methylase IME4
MAFEDLPKNHFGAILADPPWHFDVWTEGSARNASAKYKTMTATDIAALPVLDLAANDCALFLWIVWPRLAESLNVISQWGFTYKTCAICWVKADVTQIDMFNDDYPVEIGMGYWTRANSEVCLLATRGKPKRVNADVRQAIVAPRREHSRKPDGVHERIERLVSGPYLELFARQKRKGWTVWGNEIEKFAPADDWDAMWSKPFHKPEYITGNGSLSRRIETLYNLQTIEKAIESDNKSA